VTEHKHPTDFEALAEGLEESLTEATSPQRLASPSDSAEPAFVGSYQIVRKIGSGGAAVVFLARHIHPLYAERGYAIKLMHTHATSDPRLLDLFRREAYVLCTLKHPNIVETFEAGAEDGRLPRRSACTSSPKCWLACATPTNSVDRTASR
jgi:serine/threonine protein kinase